MPVEFPAPAQSLDSPLDRLVQTTTPQELPLPTDFPWDYAADLMTKPDFKRLARGLKTFLTLRHEITLQQYRTQALLKLGQLIQQNKPSETTRRACKQILTAHGVPRGPKAHAVEAAVQFLTQTLAKGPRLAIEVTDLAIQQRIPPPATLQRAKRAAAIVTTRKGFGPRARYHWSLPQSNPTPGAFP